MNRSRREEWEMISKGLALDRVDENGIEYGNMSGVAEACDKFYKDRLSRGMVRELRFCHVAYANTTPKPVRTKAQEHELVAKYE
jgi:hypothetical protein